MHLFFSIYRLQYTLKILLPIHKPKPTPLPYPRLRIHITLRMQLIPQPIRSTKEHTRLPGRMQLLQRLKDHIPVWPSEVRGGVQARYCV